MGGTPTPGLAPKWDPSDANPGDGVSVELLFVRASLLRPRDPVMDKRKMMDGWRVVGFRTGTNLISYH